MKYRIEGFRQYPNGLSDVLTSEEFKNIKGDEEYRLAIARVWEAKDLAHSRLTQEEIVKDAHADYPTYRLVEECNRAADEIAERDGVEPFTFSPRRTR